MSHDHESANVTPFPWKALLSVGATIGIGVLCIVIGTMLCVIGMTLSLILYPRLCARQAVCRVQYWTMCFRTWWPRYRRHRYTSRRSGTVLGIGMCFLVLQTASWVAELMWLTFTGTFLQPWWLLTGPFIAGCSLLIGPEYFTMAITPPRQRFADLEPTIHSRPNRRR